MRRKERVENVKRRLISWLLAVCMVIGLVPVWQIEARAKESSETIPDATVAYNGHYYGLYDMGVYWRDAKVACEKLGGHLVTITSEEEQNALLGLLANTTRAVFGLGPANRTERGRGLQERIGVIRTGILASMSQAVTVTMFK